MHGESKTVTGIECKFCGVIHKSIQYYLKHFGKANRNKCKKADVGGSESDYSVGSLLSQTGFCPICSDPAVDSTDILRGHLADVHNIERKYICAVCGGPRIGARDKIGILNHLARAHYNLTNHREPDVAKDQSETSSSLIGQQTYTTFFCNRCLKGFSELAELCNHFNLKHVFGHVIEAETDCDQSEEAVDGNQPINIIRKCRRLPAHTTESREAKRRKLEETILPVISRVDSSTHSDWSTSSIDVKTEPITNDYDVSLTNQNPCSSCSNN
jgi:hypothetical protein